MMTPDLQVGTAPYADTTFGRFAEPGVWRAILVTIQDADNNGSIYDADQLQALGSTTFNVSNTGGCDIVPPTLKSGVIDTPALSLSTAPNGTRPGTLPYAGAHMLVSDAGLQNATVTVGSQMQRQQALGQYVLAWMILQDNAGNGAQYISTLYGGDTDFSKLFPGGATIEVKQ